MSAPIQVEPRINQAIRRIMKDYAVNASVDRKDKTVDKFGRISDLGTSRRTITQLGVQETMPVIGDNPIDALSSSDAGDVGQTIYYEGLYYDGSTLRFGSGTSVTNGQNNVALNRGYNEVTRVQALDVVAGDVWIGKGNALTAGVPANADKHNVVKGTLALRQSYKAQTSFSYRDWGIVKALDLSMGRATGSNQGIDFEIEVAERVSSGQPVWYPKTGTITLLSGGTSSRPVQIPDHIIVPANHYVRISAIGTTTNMRAAANMFITIAIDRRYAGNAN